MSDPTDTSTDQTSFERIGKCLYRRGGTIYARVKLNGKQTWRSTETSDPTQARKWLKKWRSEEWMDANGIEAKGVILRRQRVTVSELIDAYMEAGFPKIKNRGEKAAATIEGEKVCLRPVRSYFGPRQAATLNHADCDSYKEWRLSGGYIVATQLDTTLSVEQKTARLIRSRLRRGTPSVDLELAIFSAVLSLAVKRGTLKANPLLGRGLYNAKEDVRHCREVAPTPGTLRQIEAWMRQRDNQDGADLVCFLAYSGLRIGEALPLDWEAVDWAERVLHVKREKKGVTPWVPILPEMETLLQGMKARSRSFLLFPSPVDPATPRDGSVIRYHLRKATKVLGIGHVTPHGLRSYFVTQARQSGLTDAEIAALIGDRTGPAIIATVYGDVRDDHLRAQAQRIQLTLTAGREEPARV